MSVCSLSISISPDEIYHLSYLFISLPLQGLSVCLPWWDLSSVCLSVYLSSYLPPLIRSVYLPWWDLSSLCLFVYIISLSLPRGDCCRYSRNQILSLFPSPPDEICLCPLMRYIISLSVCLSLSPPSSEKVVVDTAEIRCHCTVAWDLGIDLGQHMKSRSWTLGLTDVH